MISLKKKFNQMNWKVIIIILLLIIISLFATTKIIYDACFKRYDTEEIEIPAELYDMISKRQDVIFFSGGNQLQGYLYSGSAPSEETGLVVIAPGYHASADNYLWQIQSLTAYGWDVFIFDTTGSCESEGASSVGFSQELYDLDAALDYIEANYEYDNTFLFGHSRGGYSACGMLDSEHDVTAVVSVSGLNSAMEAVMEPAVKNMGKAAYGNYPMLWFYNVLLFDVKTVQMRASEEIAESQIPTVIVQGTEDDVALMDQYSIYAHKDEMNSGNVEYYICDIPGQNGHTDLMFDSDGSANDDLMEYLNEFFYDVTLQD